MLLSKIYQSIEVIRYSQEQIEGRDCWSVFARLDLDDRVKIEKGMRVGFRNNKVVFKGKIIGWGERWQVQWVCVFVYGERGIYDFNLISSLLYVSFKSRFQSLLSWYVSMLQLRTSWALFSHTEKGVDNKCCALGDECPLYDNQGGDGSSRKDGEIDGCSIMTVEDGKERRELMGHSVA
jgi:hypothetical protein